MNKVLIIGRKNPGEKNDVSILAKELAKYSTPVSVEHGFFEDVVLNISNDNIQATIVNKDKTVDIKAYDRIILINWSFDRHYTDLATAIARYAQSESIDVWPSELFTARSMTKISQMTIGALNEIPVPKTVFSMNLKAFKAALSSEISYPMIVKKAHASRGRGNYLVNSDYELLNVLAKDGVNTYIAQEYINSDKSDFRIIIANGRPVLCIKRLGSADSHLNNASSGAQTTLVDLESLELELKSLATKVSAVFKRELNGLDFMKNKVSGKYIFLEINLTPQIVNGVFVEEKAKAIAEALKISESKVEKGDIEQ